MVYNKSVRNPYTLITFKTTVQMTTNTFTRTSKTNSESTILTFDAAVDQFIRDNHAYAGADADMSVEEALMDMSTVFEAQSMLGEGGEIDAGDFIYKAHF